MLPLTALVHWRSGIWLYAAVRRASTYRGPHPLSASAKETLSASRVAVQNPVHLHRHSSRLRASLPSSPKQARRGFIHSRFQPVPISLVTSSLSFPICMTGNDYIYSQ